MWFGFTFGWGFSHLLKMCWEDFRSQRIAQPVRNQDTKKTCASSSLDSFPELEVTNQQPSNEGFQLDPKGRADLKDWTLFDKFTMGLHNEKIWKVNCKCFGNAFRSYILHVGAWEEGMQQMAVIEAFTTQRLLVKFVTFGARLPWNLFFLIHDHLSGPFGDLRPTFSQKPSLCGPPLIKISSMAAARWSRMVLAPTNSASSQSRWLDRSGVLGGEGPQKSSWGSHWPWKTGSRITWDVFALDNWITPKFWIEEWNTETPDQTPSIWQIHLLGVLLFQFLKGLACCCQEVDMKMVVKFSDCRCSGSFLNMGKFPKRSRIMI